MSSGGCAEGAYGVAELKPFGSSDQRWEVVLKAPLTGNSVILLSVEHPEASNASCVVNKRTERGLVLVSTFLRYTGGSTGTSGFIDFVVYATTETKGNA